MIKIKDILNIKTIDLDIEKKVYDEFIVKENDVKSRYINFRFLDNGKIIDITTITIRVFAKKKDATLVFNNLTKLDEKKGLAQLEFTSQMLAVEGKLDLELVLTKGLSKFSTIPFSVQILKSLNNENAIESTNEFTALQEALKTVSNIDNKADKSYVDNHISMAKADLTSIINPIKSKMNNETLVFKRYLGDIENLNSITETGLYAQAYNVSAESGSNYPTNKAGLLQVVNANGHIYQFYKSYSVDNRDFFRGRYNDLWSDWKEVATTDGIRMNDHSVLDAHQLKVREQMFIQAYPGYGNGQCPIWLDGRQERKRLCFDNIHELMINGGLVANGERLVRAWDGYSSLTDGWIRIGGNVYLEWGFHNITSTNGGVAIKDDCTFVRNDYSKVLAIIPTSIKQDNTAGNLSTALVTVLDWTNTKARFQCEFGYSTAPVRFMYIAIGVV